MNLDAARVRLPERIEVAGAVVLLLALFLLDWYGSDITDTLPGSHISGGTVSGTGWESFTSSRWIWLATIVLALGSTYAAAAAQRLEGPVRLGACVLALGALSSVLILYRIVHHPGPGVSVHGLRIAYDVKFGIWPGLIGALAMTVGGYLQLQTEGGLPWLSPPERERPPVAEPPSDQPEQSFSGLTVSQPEPGAASPPPDRAG
jgi:hypothetical protein